MDSKVVGPYDYSYTEDIRTTRIFKLRLCALASAYREAIRAHDSLKEQLYFALTDLHDWIEATTVQLLDVLLWLLLRLKGLKDITRHAIPRNVNSNTSITRTSCIIIMTTEIFNLTHCFDYNSPSTELS